MNILHSFFVTEAKLYLGLLGLIGCICSLKSRLRFFHHLSNNNNNKKSEKIGGGGGITKKNQIFSSSKVFGVGFDLF